MMRVTQLFAPLLALFAAGCVSTGSDVPTVTSFTDSIAQFDVVPPSWITADGRSLEMAAGSETAGVAFAFPSLPAVRESRLPIHADLAGFFRPNSWFRDGTFVRLPASETEQPIEIRTARLDLNLVVDIDAASMAQILRLDWKRFQGLQAAYLAWLYAQSSCWSVECFSNEAALQLRLLWRNHVLKEATFGRFAANYLNPPPPVPLKSKDGGNMFATRIYARQQLAITWGNQNLYAIRPPETATLDNSYSRITSGGTTRLQIVSDNGLRLFPTSSCRIRETSEGSAPANHKGTPPFPDSFKTMFGRWFMPIYNLFDLHNPRLLTGVSPKADRFLCPDTTRAAAPYLFLLTPSYYVKPDTVDEITGTETEARLSAKIDPTEEYLPLTRQFVLLACNVSDSSAVADEWKRMLNAASGSDPGHGRCGQYIHGLFAGKTFVELRNRFSIDGRLVEDGVLHFSTVGQALGPSLGTRANVEAAPGSGPLLDLWRASPWRENASNQRRVRVRFFTTMTDILDQAIVLEGDDIHVISISEMLR